MGKFDLEERLVQFAVTVIGIAEKLPNTYTGRHLGNQLIRSGSSPALNYGEAQAAESRADFVHKMKLILKELRETQINLRILSLKNYLDDMEMEKIQDEASQLVAIFTKSVKTSKLK